MNNGSISREFYIGRYIYLTKRLSELPYVVFGRRGETTTITIYTVNPKTGKKESRQRIGKTNKDWDRYYKIAKEREIINNQLDCIKTNWADDYTGSLAKASSEYMIINQAASPFDSALWNRFVSNSSTQPNPYPVYYKNFIMRSQFEVEVAKVLDSLGLAYKYEVEMFVGGGKAVYPDMVVNLPEYNRCGFIEALGGLDNLKYVSHNTYKLKEYINGGLYPNRDIALISADRISFPTKEMIKRSIGMMLSSIASQYVMKKS